MRAILTALLFAAQLLLAASGGTASELDFAVFAVPQRPAEQIEPLAFQVFVAPQVVAPEAVVLEQIPAAAFAVFSYPPPLPDPKPQPIKPPPPAAPTATAVVPHCGYYFDPYDGRLRWRCFY